MQALSPNVILPIGASGPEETKVFPQPIGLKLGPNIQYACKVWVRSDHCKLAKSLGHPLPEVTNRLKLLSTDLNLDLSALFLDATDILKATRTFRKCEKPRTFRLNIENCELAAEDDTNLKAIFDECVELKIGNTTFQNGISSLFDTPKPQLCRLEMTVLEMKNEQNLCEILEKCPNLTTLKMAGIEMSDVETAGLSKIPAVICALSHLISLDLSYNSTWMNNEILAGILGGMDNLEELTIIETKSDLQFESNWLPSLRSLTARGSDLRWDSVFGMVSVLEKIQKIDIRYAQIDPILVEELKDGMPNTLRILI
ncbi:unnamed protein product [Caenorhabditis sp. 36 PRJEB53466]|nr:unnamed protein product [Caenorhabditis sp. 36 PRJEB53466]